MLYFIVYDVADDDVRRRVAELLKDSGGTRVQYSAFTIELDSPHQLDILLQRIREVIGASKARVVAIPVCEADLRRAVTIVHRYELREEELLL